MSNNLPTEFTDSFKPLLKGSVFKYRDHRGGLDESMETVQEFESKDDLLKYLVDTYDFYPDHKILIKPYCFDDRIKWDTHIVTINGNACGFTDKQV